MKRERTEETGRRRLERKKEKQEIEIRKHKEETKKKREVARKEMKRERNKREKKNSVRKECLRREHEKLIKNCDGSLGFSSVFLNIPLQIVSFFLTFIINTLLSPQMSCKYLVFSNLFLSIYIESQ